MTCDLPDLAWYLSDLITSHSNCSHVGLLVFLAHRARAHSTAFALAVPCGQNSLLLGFPHGLTSSCLWPSAPLSPFLTVLTLYHNLSLSASTLCSASSCFIFLWDTEDHVTLPDCFLFLLLEDQLMETWTLSPFVLGFMPSTWNSHSL